MANKAVFPGTFDPITIGHVDVVNRNIDLFDEIIVAIGNNASKNYLFPLEKRLQWIRDVFKNQPKVRVETYEGLTVDFCIAQNARYILRGIRSVSDFDYEKQIAQMNKSMHPELDSLFVISRPGHSAISSTIVRDIIRNGGDYKQFVPPEVVI